MRKKLKSVLNENFHYQSKWLGISMTLVQFTSQYWHVYQAAHFTYCHALSWLEIGKRYRLLLFTTNWLSENQISSANRTKVSENLATGIIWKILKDWYNLKVTNSKIS